MMLDSKKKFSILDILLACSGFIVIIVIWSLASNSSSALIPHPEDVFKRLIASFSQKIGRYSLLQHTLVSLRRVVIGFSLAAVSGILVGIVMGRSKLADAIIRPLFEIVRPIPGVAWIPMAILWFGIGENSKYFIIFMGGFAHLVVNTYSGARRSDPLLIGVANMLGASNRQTFLNVVLPSCVPYIFAGLQVSLSTSWMAVLAAEMVSSTEGSGWIIIAGMESGDMTQIFVGIISIAVVGLLLAIIMRKAEQILCRWRIAGN